MRWLVVVCSCCATTAWAQTQDLGHKIPGVIGLDAGTQAAPGLYVSDRLLWFAADRATDRTGETISIPGLDLDSYANALGVSGTIALGALHASAAISVPIVKVSLNADVPPASVDRLGFGDVAFQPLKVGRRSSSFDAVASYSLFVPTRQGERPNIGARQYSHQLSAGGTLFFDDRRRLRASALASYVHYQRKLGIDITRGDSIQIQGGIGGPMHDNVDVGIAGYVLWQVTDDSGSALPAVLRGARDRVFGVGPELGIVLPSESVPTRIAARFEWDLGGRSRPVGTILAVTLTFRLWQPER